MNEVKRRLNFSAFIPSFFAVVVGLIFGFIILLISNPAQAGAGLLTILTGGLQDLRSIGRVLYFATPIIMTGLSVGFAFKTGLFNIGASGQFIVGAYAAIIVGLTFTGLGSIHWVVALLAAAVAGGLWALVPGMLKALANVHEVISSIMMNYIGMYFVNYLVFLTAYDSFRNQSLPVADSATIPRAGFDVIFARSPANAGFVIAVLAVIVTYIVLNKTTFGFELRAVGLNPHASKYAGINAKRGIILSMVISGALAGLGGGLVYLAGTGKYIHVVDVLAPEGFTGISVALLGMSNPIGILFAGLFIGFITVGGDYMQRFDFAPEIIDIIVASIIYFSAFALIIRTLLTKRRNQLGGGKIK